MTAPIRVAHIMGKMLGGGVEQVVMNYYRHIDHSRVQFDFLVDVDSVLVPKEEIESYGGRVFLIPPYQHLVQYQHELVELFRETCWPIVHSHINTLSVLPLRAAKKAGVPIRIAHSHSASGKGELAKNAVKTILRRFSNIYPTHRLACSRYAGEWLFGNDAQFDIVYNAIDLSRFTFNAETREQVRAELEIGVNQLAIGHVGRFMPQKNHRFLIEVFAEVARRRKDAVLLLVGSGTTEALVKKWADEYGLAKQIKFLGQRSDIERLYQAFDVFVLPSLYEGLCLVGIEAQRAGLLCYLSDQITREVDVTGQVHFLSIEDPKLWAEQLCSIEPGQRNNVFAAAFEQYDIDSAAEKLMIRYEELVRGAL